VSAVYIPPQDDKNKLPLNKLYQAINKQETLYPEAAFMVADDFNFTSLRHMIPNFHQHVSTAILLISKHTRPSLLRHSANQIMTPNYCFLFQAEAEKISTRDSLH
jgi:hypothetical protein